MTPAEEQALIDDWKAGDMLAGAALVKAFEGLIRRVISRYITVRCGLDDLMQVGRMSLLSAAKVHDAERGRLSSIAFLMIMDDARKHASRQRFPVSVSLAERKSGANPLTVSFDAPIGREGNRTVGDTVACDANDSAANVDADALVELLSARERDVIERLYVRGETLEQIGAHYCVSKQAICVTKKKALAKLKAEAA